MAQIRHNVFIDCKPVEVYNAITTKSGIQGWWTVDTVIEPLTGSIAEFNFGDRYHNKMRIRDLIPNKLVTWQCLEGDPEWIGTEFMFDLELIDGKTLLRFGHNKWEEITDFYAHCNYQWGRYMVSLKKICEKGIGDPFHIEENTS